MDHRRLVSRGVALASAGGSSAGGSSSWPRSWQSVCSADGCSRPDTRAISAAVYVAALGLLVFELGRVFWRSRRVRSRAASVGELARASDARRGRERGACRSGRSTEWPWSRPPRQGSPILALFSLRRPVRPHSASFGRHSPARGFQPAEASGGERSSAACLVGASGRGRPSQSARKSAVDVVVESEIEILASGRAPFAWEFPVSDARDIQVTLDGKRLPVSITPGGASGKVAIPQAGNHLLRIRRSAATRMEEGLECLRLPVNAMPIGSRGRGTARRTASKTASCSPAADRRSRPITR